MKKNERTEQEFRDAARKSFSIAGMCRELGLGAFGANYRRIHKAIKEYNIDISHFTGCGWNVGLRFIQMNKKNIHWMKYWLKIPIMTILTDLKTDL